MPTYGVGRAPTAEEVKAWDLTIPPDGQGLPPGRGTAVLGKSVYAERCASCHGENGEDPKYRALVGGRGPLTSAELSENLDWLLGGRHVLTIGRFWARSAVRTSPTDCALVVRSSFAAMLTSTVVT